jgi:hypothetical protein
MISSFTPGKVVMIASLCAEELEMELAYREERRELVLWNF